MNADLSIYLVTDSDMCRQAGRSVADTVARAIAGGVTAVQIRDKGRDGGDFLRLVEDVVQVVPDDVAVFINDRVDVFLSAQALGFPVDGVHVGQSDLPASVVRQLIGPDALLGVSAATVKEIRAAEEDGADYVGIGALRHTLTKEDAPPALGVSGIVALAARTPLPTVAIGGIGVDDIAGLREGGIAGVAVVSAICAASDPMEAARELRQEWKGQR